MEIFSSPLQPNNLLYGSSWIIALKLVAWWNGLLLINIFPALPLDRQYLGRCVNSVFDRQTAIRIVTRCMLWLSVGLVLMLFFMRFEETTVVPSPGWCW